ncbi:lysozyme c-1 [Copidosoma floridanum]|uniref:lysozyme c-1 n=1 Tax=Copidosoma floridanum TaxID=29053 RepID=UPI0006C9D020|nr:lysozyme c-1 [Copidosoma floridanum]
MCGCLMATSRSPVPILVLLAIVVAATAPSEGRILGQCEAAQALAIAGVSRSFVSNYVCIMKNESGINTSKKTGPGHKSSYAYGVFQITSDVWCSAYRKGGKCNAKCDDFLDDDIRDDIECAKKIQAARGFQHWKGWTRGCKQKQLPNVAPCFGRGKRSADGEPLLTIASEVN